MKEGGAILWARLSDLSDGREQRAGYLFWQAEWIGTNTLGLATRIGKCSVPGSEAIWSLQIRINLELQSDLEAGVRCIWRLFNLKLLQIGKRVKFARHTVYSS